MTGISRWTATVAIVYAFVHSITVNVRPLLGIAGGGSFYTVPKMVNLGIWAGLVSLAVVAVASGLRRIEVPRRWWRDPLIIAFGASVVMLAIAPFLSTRTPLETAFFGFAYRFDGPYVILLSLLIAAAFAWFVALDKRFATIGLWTFIGLSVFNAGFGILQSQGVDVWAALGVPGLGTSPRTTLGNPAFASLIPAMGAVIIANLLMDPKVRSVLWKLWAVLGLGLVLAFASGSSSSRSAIIGYVIVLGVSMIVNIARSTRASGVLFPIVVTLALLGATAAGAASNSYSVSRFNALTSMVAGEQIDGSWEQRLRFWDIAWEAIKDQPILPYGSGAYAIVMWEKANEQQTRELYGMFVPNEYVDRTFRQENILVYVNDDGEQIAQRINSDKAHNYILDIWMSYGLFATIALVAFLVILIVRLVTANTAFTWSVLAAGVVYGFFSMAWFPAVATDPLVFALLGVGWGAAERARNGVPDDAAALVVETRDSLPRNASRAERRRHGRQRR